MLFSHLFYQMYEGEEGGAGAAVSDPPAGDPPAGDPPAKPKTFTQAEVDKLMMNHRKTLQSKNEELIKQLEDTKTHKHLSDQQAQELQDRIDELTRQGMTKEELAKQDKELSEKKYKKELELKGNEAKRWQELYTNSTVERSIIDASAKHEAFSATQIVAILKPNTRLTEVLGANGQPTGQYTATVSFPDVDKDEQPIILDLSPSEAVKRMKDKAEFANLFKSTATSGLGGQGSTGKGGVPDLKNPRALQEWKKQNPGKEPPREAFL